MTDGLGVDGVDGVEVAGEGADEVAALFRILGDPTRVRLLLALADEGEVKVGHLAQTTGVRESTVSHALRLLRASNVVTTRREGRSIHYSLADEHVRHLLVDTRAHVRHGYDDATADTEAVAGPGTT